MLQRDTLCDCISKQQGEGQGHAGLKGAPNTKYKLTPGLQVQICDVMVWAYKIACELTGGDFSFSFLR